MTRRNARRMALILLAPAALAAIGVLVWVIVAATTAS